MKTTIKSIKTNRCSISYTDGITDERVEMELFAPAAGGYVKIESPNYQQICDGLSRRGETLYWDCSGNLADLIRREYRRMRSNERRVLARISA